MAQGIITANWRDDRPPDLERAEPLNSRIKERRHTPAETGRKWRGVGPRTDTSDSSLPAVAERVLDGDPS